jgi:hypothetical protein
MACVVCARRPRHAGFGGHGPQILAVVEDLRIGHVIEAVDLRLQLEQQLGVADVLAQPGGHRRGILEQGREDAAIGGQDRIFAVEDIEGRGSVVGVDTALTLLRM